MATGIDSIVCGPDPSSGVDNPASLNRRSVSIFSRRGTSTPQSSHAFHIAGFAQPVTSQVTTTISAGPSRRPISQMPPPKKAWKLGNRPSQSSNKTGGKGTILRAVPRSHSTAVSSSDSRPSTAKSPTALELENAANQEILGRAFGGMVTSYPIHQSHSSPTSQVQPIPDGYLSYSLPQAVSFPVNEDPLPVSPISPIRTTTLSKRTRKDDKAKEIGVWKDGQIFWRQSYSSGSSTRSSDGSSVDMRSNSTSSSMSSVASTPYQRPQQKSPRPKIHVIIPETYSKPLSALPVLAPSSLEPIDIDERPSTAPSEPTAAPPMPPQSRTPPPPLQTSVVPPTIKTYAPTPVRPNRAGSTPLEPYADELNVARTSHKMRPSMSSSNYSREDEDYDKFSESNYSNNSNRSSMTSIGAAEIANFDAEIRPLDLHRTGSAAFSIISPAMAGVFDGVSRAGTMKTRHMNSTRSTMSADTLMPIEDDVPPLPQRAEFHDASSAEKRCTQWLESRKRGPSVPRLNTDVNGNLSRSNSVHRFRSPTLSEAERDLQSTISDIAPYSWAAEVKEEPAQSDGAPPIPARKSRKSWHTTEEIIQAYRNSLAESSDSEAVSSPGTEEPHDGVYAGKNLRRRTMQTVQRMPTVDRRKLAQSRPLSYIPEKSEVNITPEAAELVLFRIMYAMTSIEDLAATAQLNWGFYRVYKRHEMQLIRSVTMRNSLAAWEFMETTIPSSQADMDSAAPRPDWTPKAYLATYRTSVKIINQVKSELLKRCQSILRATTVAALRSENKEDCRAIDDALWRIWTFCVIFGSNKGREDEIIAQMDWLRGGVLAHQSTCSSTVGSGDSFVMSNVLLSAAEHFARGNTNGLTAEELYDITELWTSLGVLVQGLEGRTDQARCWGVFDASVEPGDVDGEEAMLEEWQYHILTLGLKATVSMASAVEDDTSAPFQYASQQGYMKWAPPILGGSRSTFLKEAVSRVYEVKIVEAFREDVEKQEMRELRRARGQSYAAELRLRKVSGEGRWKEERPMSGYSVLSVLDSPPSSQRGSLPPSPQRTGSAVSPSGHTVVSDSLGSIISPLDPIAEQHAVFQSPVGLQTPAFRRASVQHPPVQHASYQHASFQQANVHYANVRHASVHHPSQTAVMENTGHNSSERAIGQIMEMGFSLEQAKNSLRATDMGDGLRVDRAVEWLLTQM